jgi:predicted phosphodiesterase
MHKKILVFAALFVGGLLVGILLWSVIHNLKFSPVSLRRPEAILSATLSDGTVFSCSGAIIRKTNPLTLRLFAPNASLTIENCKSHLNLVVENIHPSSEINFSGDIVSSSSVRSGESVIRLETEMGGSVRVRSPYKESFCFIALGDFACSSQEDITRMNQVLISLVERSKADFVVLLGDIVRNDSTMLEKVADSLARLPFPVYALVGNHDYNSSVPDAFCRQLAPMNYHFVYSDVLFIFFNNADEFLPSCFPSLEMEKVVSLFENSSAKAVLFFCHKPVEDPRPDSDHAMNRPSAAEYLKQKFLGSNVSAVLSGHIGVWNLKKERNTIFVVAGEGMSDNAKAALVKVEPNGSVNVEPIRVWETK